MSSSSWVNPHSWICLLCVEETYPGSDGPTQTAVSHHKPALSKANCQMVLGWNASKILMLLQRSYKLKLRMFLTDRVNLASKDQEHQFRTEAIRCVSTNKEDKRKIRRTLVNVLTLSCYDEEEHSFFFNQIYFSFECLHLFLLIT